MMWARVPRILIRFGEILPMIDAAMGDNIREPKVAHKDTRHTGHAHLKEGFICQAAWSPQSREESLDWPSS
jgi:hypothetical protein